MNLSAKLHDYAEPSYIDVKATNPFRDGKKRPSIIKKKKTILNQFSLWDFFVYGQILSQTSSPR